MSHSTAQKEEETMFVWKSTHENALAAAEARHERTRQHRDSLASRSDEVMRENASLSLLALDVLAWMNEIVLPANGKNRRELSSRRAEMREQAQKLGILVEDVVVKDRKEESA